MARKYTKELLEPLVAQSTSVVQVLELLGLRQNGGAHAHISRTIRNYGIDTSHFHPRAVTARRPRRPPEEVLVRLRQGSARTKPHVLRRAMLESGASHRCAICANDGTWQGKPLTLQIDHIDGDFLNNELSNLRFLCPNCHRLTPNFAGRSKGRFTSAASSPETTP